MFSRRSSRQGADATTDGLDWAAIQKTCRALQYGQQISKETFSSIRKGLKGTPGAACSSLTLLDTIAMNTGSDIRNQLADSAWIEMLISACYKYPSAAAPICQLLSNWTCSYNQEKLGHAAQYAAQALRQKNFYIPVPTAIAYHMAEVSQTGMPMTGFDQGADFASILGLNSSVSAQGSMSARQESGTMSDTTQAMGSSMGQKVEAMKQGAQQLREIDQICQSILDAGPAAAGTDCKQHMQKGGQLASQCNGWANEAQVMIACEPSDQILAALLETNDQLLSAVTGWDATAQRLAMLQSHQPAMPHQSNPNPSPSSNIGNSSRITPPDTTTSSGGAFWDTLHPQGPQSHAPEAQHQSQHAQHQQLSGTASSTGRTAHDRKQAQQSSGQVSSTSTSYLDDLTGLPQSQYPHQQAQPQVDTWQPFGAGPQQPQSASSHQPLAAATASNQPAQTAYKQAPDVLSNTPRGGYQGSVLSYTLKDQQPRSNDAVLRTSDPFAGNSAGAHQSQYASPDSPFKSAAAAANPFDSLPRTQASLPDQGSGLSQQQHPRTDSSAAAASNSSSGLAAHVNSNPSFPNLDSLESTATPANFTGMQAAVPLSAASNSALQTVPGALQQSNSTSSRSQDVASQGDLVLRQQLEQLQAQQAQHDREVEGLKQQHAAQLEQLQAQAVTKMKELIEKVKQQTLKERQQAELRLEEAHKAEENAVAQLQSLRRECRDKDATIEALQQRLSQQGSTQMLSPSQDPDSQPTNKIVSSATLDSASAQQQQFGGIPRPRSASSQLPSLGGAVTRRPVQRVGSHLDNPSAGSSVQAYYRQPALRVRFTPGQLEELTQPASGISHRDWSAQLKLPPLQ